MLHVIRSTRWFVLVALIGNVLQAADPPKASPTLPFLSPQSDRLLSLTISQALAADPELAHLPIMVDVLNKVAILGGGVPDETTKTKIEAVVRKVPGIRSVQNGCWITASEDPFRQLVHDRLDGVQQVAKAATPRPPSLVIQPHDGRSSTRPDPVAIEPLLPPALKLTRPEDRRPGASVTVQRMPLRFPSLEEPVGPGGTKLSELPMPSATTPSYPTIPPTNVPTKPLSTTEELQRIQHSQPRWKLYKVELNGNRLTISGKGLHPGDAWALAEALRDVPGIDRIVVK